MIAMQHLSPWFVFTAAVIAMSLGALHALEPRYGKTTVVAYLVGSRRTGLHAALRGLISTASHTVGALALDTILLYALRYIVPEQLCPWLGILSGFIIAVLGAYMLLRRLTGRATYHSHLPGKSRGHWFPFRRSARTFPAEAAPALTPSPRIVSLSQRVIPTTTGEFIPSPAALIVPLSAFALHRVGLGLLLLLAFSFGLAAVRIGGMRMVHARRFMTRLHIDGPLTSRWLPLASSSLVIILGVAVAVQAAAALHITGHLFTKQRLGPVLFVTGLGLLLGMRHSTDADHVVAISTIVSKQRSIRNAALIGSVWGLGHTITIFVVGALIILFRIEIPKRVGLSMEFCVALMLILLGVLNLTGTMQKIVTSFKPALPSSAVPLAQKLRRRSWLPFTALGACRDRLGSYQFFRPLIIGLVHGLAGSAAVALLVLSTIHNPVWATVYLLIFGFGTMVGMMCMTSAIAVPLAYAGERFSKLGRYFGIASGIVSVLFGAFLVYQLGYLGGLFTSHPEWTPQ